MMRQQLNYGLVAAAATVITWFSVQPLAGAPTAAGFSLYTILHVVAYFGLAAAILLAIIEVPHAVEKAILLSFLFGFAIELVQMGLPTRTFAARDILLNLGGAVILAVDRRLGLAEHVVAVQDRLLLHLTG